MTEIKLTQDTTEGKLKEITDQLEKGIIELFGSGRYQEYLDVMSKFHNYSLNNTLLIAMQKPDATHVAGYRTWQNEFSRNVKKGEKGIKIIAPSQYKVKVLAQKTDQKTGLPERGPDGEPLTEEQEVTKTSFRVISVFDISQTEGKELPALAQELYGGVEQYEDFMAALDKASPVPVGFEQIGGSSHGYYHMKEKRIAIREGMDELQTLKTTVHEIAHASLHEADETAGADRRTREVEAESVAYTVCRHYGLDTSGYSFGYIAGWSSGKELTELKSALETIRSTASGLIKEIDKNLAELTQVREQPQEETQGDIKELYAKEHGRLKVSPKPQKKAPRL